MALPPEITIEDLRNLVNMVQAAIHELRDLAQRVDALEKANEASYEAAVALKDNQRELYEAQKSQQEVNKLMKQSLDRLLEALGPNNISIQ